MNQIPSLQVKASISDEKSGHIFTHLLLIVCSVAIQQALVPYVHFSTEMSTGIWLVIWKSVDIYSIYASVADLSVDFIKCIAAVYLFIFTSYLVNVSSAFVSFL